MQPNIPRLFTILALSLSLGWVPARALAQETSPGGASGDNTAVAVNTKDGSSTFKVSFRIVRTSSDVVDESNIAFAFSSCEGCETVAIAFQVVLVGGTPSIVIPENYAIALNFECTSCETLASAYQFVLGTDGQVHFSAEGNRLLAEIRMGLREIASSEMTLDEMQAQLDLLAGDLRTVLTEEMVTSGPEGVEVQTIDGQGSPEPTTQPSPDPTSSPGTSPAPDPSSSPTSPETTTPTESPSATTPPATTEPSPSSSPSSSPSPVATASP